MLAFGGPDIRQVDYALEQRLGLTRVGRPYRFGAPSDKVAAGRCFLGIRRILLDANNRTVDEGFVETGITGQFGEDSLPALAMERAS